MAKKKSTKAHQVAGCIPSGKQWASNKKTKGKTKNLAKLTTSK